MERIQRGGKLASLVVDPASGSQMKQLKEYRRGYRVLIAAGGEDYIKSLALSLASDQRADTTILPEKLVETDVVVVPVLLDSALKVQDTKTFWNNNVEPTENDRNFDITRANDVISFPRGTGMWNDYLASEIETAQGQGFDVLKKGVTLTVKKNGKILRRTTGLPAWDAIVGTMEVMDGSRFGMPGDSERYGGP